jgi:Mg2+-importing ATPase
LLPITPEAPAWWLRPLADLLRELGTSASGLSSAQARSQLQRHGKNVFRDRPEQSLPVQFAARFRNPLVLILVVASLVSALTGEKASFVIIVVMVLVSVTLDFVQERRAGKAAQKLRRSVQVRVTVIRDGQPRVVAATRVAPGDIVLLQAGNLVPADGVLLDARDLHVDQAVLTGESFPVERRAGAPAASGTDIADASNALFMGTSVVSGTARLLIYRTGSRTAIGQIAATLNREPPPTAFDIGTRRFGMLIMRLTVLLVLFVMMVNALTHKPLLDSFLFAVALAVGLTPELLPMIVSVTLSRGAIRLAAKRVIVKRLAAIEDLGSMDVLCVDKTGTLTEAVISLQSHIDIDGRDCARALTLAQVNSRFETGLKSPLDAAILAHDAADTAHWQKVDEAPFDFERRRVSVLADDGQRRMLIVKGAPEDLLRLSDSYAPGGDRLEAQPFDAASRARAERLLDRLAASGLRVLAIAIRPFDRGADRIDVRDERGLVFVGFVSFVDPPKASAAKAVDALRALGVAVKIVTGDNELVTRHVCEKLGVPVDGILTGAEIAAMDDVALSACVLKTNLYCRVNPAQKNRIILALKRRGRVVGFLGDGINDAPALHAADVSLSVDTATDVAREAADLILLKRDLHVLHDGVIEGRRTFANIRKYIMMGTSSNFGNMFSMAGASLFLPFLPMLPTQILLNNVLYDLSEVAIPLDAVDDDELQRPRAWDMSFIRNFMWVMGPISSLFDFATFFVLLAVLHADESLFQTGWFVESLATQVLVIFVIRTRGNPLASRPHAALVASSLAVVVAGLAIPWTSLGRYFGMQPPPPLFYGSLAALVLGYLLLAEVTKRFFYARLAALDAR